MSLHFGSQRGCKAVFVHVPPFDVIGMAEQLSFIRKLIDVVGESELQQEK
jgi:hypothetical protein